MSTIPCKCGNPSCLFEDNATAVAEFCNHHTITVYGDIVDDSGRLVEPLAMERLSRLIANKAGVPEYVPVVKRCLPVGVGMTGKDIEDVGLYAISVDAGGDRQYEQALWVVPRSEGDPDVSFAHYEHGTPAAARYEADRRRRRAEDVPQPVKLTPKQAAALAWAIGRLATSDDPCRFACELEQLLLQSL